jgi:hypothetical protein
MPYPPQLKFNFLNLKFALVEGLNKMSRGIRLVGEGHYLLFPIPLLIQSINKLLFKFLNGLASPMSDKILQWRLARPLADWG